MKEISFIQSCSENKQVPYPYRPPDRFTRSFARIKKSIQPSSHRRSWSSSNYRNLRFKFSSSCHPQILWFKEISQKMWMMVWWNRLRWVVVLTGSMCMSWMLGLCSGEQTRRVFLEWEDVVPLRVSIYIYIYIHIMYIVNVHLVVKIVSLNISHDILHVLMQLEFFRWNIMEANNDDRQKESPFLRSWG